MPPDMLPQIYLYKIDKVALPSVGGACLLLRFGYNDNLGARALATLWLRACNMAIGQPRPPRNVSAPPEGR